MAPVIPEEVLASHPLGQFTPTAQQEVFSRKIREGRFFGQGGQMPPFSMQVLSDGDVADLMAAFLLPGL